MRADIRSMCGLGFPPTTYSQNASECLNRYVKENAKGSEDVTSSLVEVVKNISMSKLSSLQHLCTSYCCR